MQPLAARPEPAVDGAAMAFGPEGIGRLHRPCSTHRCSDRAPRPCRQVRSRAAGQQRDGRTAIPAAVPATRREPPRRPHETHRQAAGHAVGDAHRGGNAGIVACEPIPRAAALRTAAHAHERPDAPCTCVTAAKRSHARPRSSPPARATPPLRPVPPAIASWRVVNPCTAAGTIGVQVNSQPHDCRSQVKASARRRWYQFELHSQLAGNHPHCRVAR